MTGNPPPRGRPDQQLLHCASRRLTTLARENALLIVAAKKRKVLP
jgi:hypothetical protein